MQTKVLTKVPTRVRTKIPTKVSTKVPTKVPIMVPTKVSTKVPATEKSVNFQSLTTSEKNSSLFDTSTIFSIIEESESNNFYKLSKDELSDDVDEGETQIESENSNSNFSWPIVELLKTILFVAFQ